MTANVAGVDSSLALLAAILSGGFTLLGAWVGAYSGRKQAEITIERQAEIQNRKDHLARLEELYAIVERWAGAAAIHYTTVRRVMRGEMTYDQANHAIAKIGSRVDGGRMTALADLYFPDARPAYNALISARDRVADIVGEYKSEYKQVGPSARSRSQELTSALTELDRRAEDYKKALAAQMAAHSQPTRA